jgi:hypothetical protein
MVGLSFRHNSGRYEVSSTDYLAICHTFELRLDLSNPPSLRIQQFHSFNFAIIASELNNAGPHIKLPLMIPKLMLLKHLKR